MKKILILGDGFLGTAIKNFALNNFEVHSTTKRIEFLNERVLYFDVNQRENLKSLIHKLQPEIVINCIALANIEGCEINREDAYKINLEFPIFLAQVCKIINHKMKVIHISTDHFNSDMPVPRDETVVFNCPNYYSFTKMKSDETLSKNFPNVLVLRTNFFGYNIRSTNSLINFALSKLNSGQEFIGFTDILFNPVSVNFLFSAIQNLIYNHCSGVFNIASDRVISKFNFFEIVEKELFGYNRFVKKGLMSAQPHLVNRPKYMALDNSKLKLVSGIKVPTIESMIREVLASV